MNDVKNTIEVLKVIEKYCGVRKDKPRAGFITYSIGGLDSTQFDFPNALSHAIQELENKPSETELHDIWFKNTGIEISVTINNGLKAIYNFRRKSD